MWGMERSDSVDELNERLIEDVRAAGIKKIGFVRMTGRKRINKLWWNEDIRDARKEHKKLNKRRKGMRMKRLWVNISVWIVYMKQQRLTKRKIRDAKVQCERNAIQALKGVSDTGS